ncbi:MAG TPA: hypothetical protein VG796_24065 [Verrucomicrobiales bacterium]|nr:hypothetical protein [Verrucomicrobiales bacterium]
MTPAVESILEKIRLLPYEEQIMIWQELGEEVDREKLVALRKEIAIGIEQADAGDFVEFTTEDVIEEGRKRREAQEKR